MVFCGRDKVRQPTSIPEVKVSQVKGVAPSSCYVEELLENLITIYLVTRDKLRERGAV